MLRTGQIFGVTTKVVPHSPTSGQVITLFRGIIAIRLTVFSVRNRRCVRESSRKRIICVRVCSSGCVNSRSSHLNAGGIDHFDDTVLKKYKTNSSL